VVRWRLRRQVRAVLLQVQAAQAVLLLPLRGPLLPVELRMLRR
jgi:hypothetical protein